MKEAIHTPKTPAAIGPYSQAILANGTLYISGQLGVTAQGEFAGASVQEQAKQSLENIKNILAAAKLDMSNVVKTTIFLADMDDFAKVNEIYAQYFSKPYPARSTVAIKTLPKNALVEIETVAVKMAGI